MDQTEQLLIPELESYFSEFELIKAEAQKIADELSEQQFIRKPEGGGWSVAECLSHLNVLGEQLLPRIEQAVDQGHNQGRYGAPPFRYGMISRLFIQANSPSPQKKIKTMKSYNPLPVDELNKTSVISTFVDLQDGFRIQVEKANGLDLKRIKVTSPALPLLRLSLGAWFAATVAHEKRHLKQAERVVEEIL